ncbi:MAG: AAA family ATPase [Microcoleaceae cyanobacterium MO_207.B10]|nr:AAA family ATPase [Microcoleaceae cyanobacterium MO_207.B10]
MNKQTENSDSQTTIHIPDYHIIETIYSGSRTIVYQATRIDDKLPVIIKLLKNPYPTFNELVQFRNQYTIARNLNSPLIIQTYSLDPYKNSYILVMEDFGGISLKEWEGRVKIPSIEDFLQIAIALCNALEILYQERIIHKDIKPSNILINPETKQVKLIDFSIASLLPRETQEIQNPNVLEGTLGYISPEQTGRMNRGIDYRSDFYSLGVTFYELLSGELPFKSEDGMELVHCHLAKAAPLLHKIHSEIPSVLSNIVNKLMAKNAESRYQSALGLKLDLEYCLTQLQQTGEIKEFEIAQRDVSDRFLIPEKLYGREQEVQTLLEAFDKVANGASELMLVTGFSGIGKTAVVNEVHKPIVQRRGYFIKGKFDQFNRNIPFSALVQAFRSLIGQLLTEFDTELANWKSKILETVGESGQVLIEVIPELEQIIGEQPPVPELSGNAAQNRFNLLFQKFIAIFSTPDHPLVMFLDDLQWADSASLNLMQLLMSESNISYLFIIGAYRDNEVFPAHPLMLTLEELKKTGATLNTLNLKALSLKDVNQLTADTLSCSVMSAEPLTELVYQKTQGNPFFTTQFLKALHEEGYITFDIQVGHWECDMVTVRTLTLTEDVVEFMAMQLQKLPTETQDILKLAACIGNQFDLETLATVSDRPSTETATDLWKALKEGFVIPINEVYKFYQDSSLVNQQPATSGTTQAQITVSYKFLHDRVQQAAYSLIPEDEKTLTHLRIGRLLLQGKTPETYQEIIFSIVNQLNYGIKLLTSESERYELAELNLVAGQKAKTSAAYEAAFRYLNVGLELLPTNSWQYRYDMTLNLFELAAEVASLNGNFQQMEEWINVVLSQAKTAVDKMKVYAVKVQAYMAQIKKQEALDIGLEALSLVGVNLPKSPESADIEQAFAETKKNIDGRSIDELMKLPLMVDEEKLAIARTLASIFTPSYQVASPFLPLVVCELINLSLIHGNSAFSGYGYAFYGLLLNGLFEDIEAAYQFGKLGSRLVEQFNAPEIKASCIMLVGVCTVHCKAHFRDTLPILAKAYQSSLESGNFEFAGYATMHTSSYAYCMGQELTLLARDMVTTTNALKRLKQDGILSSHQIFHQAVLNLINPCQKPDELNGTVYNEETLLPKLKSNNDMYALYLIYFNKLILSCLFSEPKKAYENALFLESYLEAAPGLLYTPVFYFYDSLAHLAVYSSLDAQQESLLQKVEMNQKKMKKWAIHAPMNCQHKFDLVEAERCRVLNDKIGAVDLYDRAIAGAQANNFIQEEALANELAAKFYLDWGKKRIAQEYMIEAYYDYARWAAKTKTNDLEKRYPLLLQPILQQERLSLNLKESIGTLAQTYTANTTSTNISDVLDFTSLLKAAQSISSSLELDTLISSLTRIILENSGANKVVLMLPEENSWEVKAMTWSDRQGIQTTLTQQCISDCQDIPVKIIHYVKNTKKTIVINNCQTDIAGLIGHYMLSHHPQSISCNPIINQGHLVGIIYLENQLTSGVFNHDRISVIKLLSSQVAISLENAQLYQQAQQALQDLQQAQLQIVQSEKMSALGNLVAGIAHEINNPVGFISGNINEALASLEDVTEFLQLYQEKFPNPGDEITEKSEELEIEYLLEDLPKMLASMQVGCERIKGISISLRTFSRADKEYKVPFNIHEGIESTLLILKHRLKANEKRPAIEVVTKYVKLPQIDCFPGQLNQVFMNIIANAIDALDESIQERTFAEIKTHPNRITITNSLENNQVKISIADNGKGMSEEVKQKIFDHLFTTKAVGKGTGLGLAIARQIIVEKHQGSISVNSEIGVGTEFIIFLPLK